MEDDKIKKENDYPKHMNKILSVHIPYRVNNVDKAIAELGGLSKILKSSIQNSDLQFKPLSLDLEKVICYDLLVKKKRLISKK
mgnify:CR=1 FL=1